MKEVKGKREKIGRKRGKEKREEGDKRKNLQWIFSADEVPHSRIHRKTYYRWLGDLINPLMIKTSDDLVDTLKMVRMRLQSGSLPKHIIIEMRLEA